ncbi:MAG: hypothetical protein V1849_00485 [Chloroflexota bacterium]
MKRMLLVSLVLVLVGTVFLPGAALAALPEDFSASGTISAISDPVEFAAGKSGRFVVEERTVTGALSGDVGGDFALTYRANVELATQAGNLHGTLSVGSYVFRVQGKIEPLGFVPAPVLTISGQWTLIEGARGQGNFDAWAVFVPDAQGHVVFILASSITMTGQWQP